MMRRKYAIHRFPILVGLTGEKNPRRITVHKHLLKKHSFEGYSIAYHTERMIKDLFMLSDNQLSIERDIPDERWSHLTPNRMIQAFDNDIIRSNMCHLFPEIAIESSIGCRRFSLWYEKRIDEYRSACVVVRDVIHNDEIATIDSFGGCILNIIGPEDVIVEEDDRHFRHFTIIDDAGDKELLDQVDFTVSKMKSVNTRFPKDFAANIRCSNHFSTNSSCKNNCDKTSSHDK